MELARHLRRIRRRARERNGFPNRLQAAKERLGEFFNYPGWREGEYKAFAEFCTLRRANVKFFGFTRGDEQVGLKVIHINS
jgi:hypothetical protein